MTSSNLAALGSRIKALRMAKGLTQAELAEKCGYEPLTVSRFERGAYSPAIDTLAAIAQVLDVPMQDFFSATGTDELVVEKLRHQICDMAYATSDASTLTRALAVLRKNLQGQ
ncbi:helix-turn-helix transcriptional regulator [Pseudomonas guariconensis]|uniref:helix-turn-helix domain-containing protein n=1 Tax=Pseudomonas guariconensis TaxID=1288410 RepID=UPI002B062488|nr:helix-turn-helix transcriptional regulator [Pseudomonas guariconensis]